MKNKNIINFHYLSFSYKLLLSNIIIHYILFFLEMFILLLQIIEIYFNDFNLNRFENFKVINPIALLLKILNKLPDFINFIIYLLIVIILLLNYYLLNNSKLKANIFSKIMVNISELLFYRLLNIFIFDYLFITTGIYLYINIIITFIYILVLIFHFSKNYLALFFLNLIIYPYDSFSMIIDLHLLAIKIFLSLSSNIYNEKISQFFLMISLIILFILLLYLSYLMIKKSYYLMINCNLNKIRYSTILGCCFIIIFILIIDIKEIYNIFYQVCFFNILIICLLLVCYFYNPYNYCKFDKDDNEENIFYYFFIFDRDKNKYLLLEEIIENHLFGCNKCNLCKKYNQINIMNKNEEIDLYYIISDGKNYISNLFNKIVREIKKKGRKSFENNSYFLINLFYIYSLALNQKDFNLILNLELLFEIINNEKTQVLEEYNICLKQIKYTNNFFIKANKIVNSFYEIFDEKNLQKKSRLFLKFADLLDSLKYKEIKSMKSNINNNNGNSSNIEGLPNCNNLLTICSIFYEELYNESISNSGVYIRDSPNILEDLINNNYKNGKQITLEINIQNFKVKIIRVGEYMNKYENYNLFDLFPSIVKKRQIILMKKILLSPNNDLEKKQKSKQSIKHKKQKIRKEEKQYLNFSFIIEEKEENNIFHRLLKLKLSLILLNKINYIIYLNGVYTIDKDIILTEKKKDEEVVLYFGNKEQINKYATKKFNNLIIKKDKNFKYIGNTKLIKDSNCFVGCKTYTVYHLLSSKDHFNKQVLYNNKNNILENIFHDDKNSNSKNNELLIFNDMTSQASSTTSSLSRNNLIYNSKTNKKTQNNEDITKKFKIIKISLLLFLFLFLIFIIFQSIYLINSQKNLNKGHNFYLLFLDYSNYYYTLFFSSLSLVCIANTTNSSDCLHFINEISEVALSFKDTNIYEKIVNEIQNDNYSNNNNNFDNIEDDDTSPYFINFTKLIFTQNEILYQNLKDKLQEIIQYLTLFNDNQFTFLLNENISHYKINQIINEDNIKLILKKENFTFYEFFLLMTSRFGIIVKDIENLIYPIYILNKTGEEIFNNIYLKKKLNSYQENIYLMILDYNKFTEQLNLLILQIGMILDNLKEKFKKYIFLFINLNLLFFIVIIFALLGYICLYLIIIFKILDDVYKNLKEKLGNITKKDILRKKIDNLKLLLKFYENDINVTLNDLNTIYNDYRDKYNLKIKEESKSIKKEGSIKIEKNKNSIMNLIKIFKKFELYKYSKRKKVYFNSLLILIISCLSSFIISMTIWILFFKNDNISKNWSAISSQFASETSEFMNNFLLMFLSNQTLNYFGKKEDTKDYISYIFSKLTNLYEGDKYFNSLNYINSINDKNINYDCLLFYTKLNNDFFDQLKIKYNNEQAKLYYTMYFFCEYSSVMIFKKYKTIYLQLFNQVKIIMENFNNNSYIEIIKFIKENEIVKIEIIFLITYIYLIDIIYDNIKIFILLVMNTITKNIIINSIIFLLILFIFIFVIFFVYIRNISKDTKKFINIKKVFKVCNINE